MNNDEFKNFDLKVLKFRKKSFKLIYIILKRIEKGEYPSKIARQLSTSPQRIRFYLKKLENFGLIKEEVRSSAKFYTLTKKGKAFVEQFKSFSIDTRKNLEGVVDREVRTHDLAIKFPILRDNPDFDWDKESKMNNWIQKSKIIDFPIGMTIVKKAKKSIVVYFHQFNANDLTELMQKIMKGTIFVYEYLRKNGILIDIFGGEVISQHFSIKLPKQMKDALERVVKKGMRGEIDLGRLVKSIYPTKLRAKVWYDFSLGELELETDDLLYVENFFLMPERVARFEKLAEFIIIQQSVFAKNLEMHQKAIEEIAKGVGEFASVVNDLKKLLEKLNGGDRS